MENDTMTYSDDYDTVKEKTQRASFYPWVITLLSAAFLFYKYIMQVSPSIMTNELMKAFHVHGMGLGNLAATFFYSYLITQLFVGVLLDRFSPRFLSAFAILTSALGTYIFSGAQTLLVASLSRGLMGIGAAFATVSYMKLAANWFKPNRFAFVGGLLATAAMVGAIFGEAPLAWLVKAQGWRSSLEICAWLGLMIGLFFIVFVRDEPKVPVVPKKLSQAKYAISLADVWSILSKKQNWLLTFYSGMAFSPVAVFGGLWGNPFVIEAYNLKNTEAATLISLIFFGLAIGGPVLGFISDRLNKRRVMMLLGCTLSLVTVSAVIYIPELPIPLLAIFLFLFGFGTGAFMLGFAIGKELNPIAMAATVIALINTGDAIFGAFTEPMIGHFLDLGWGHQIVNGVHHFSVADYKTAFLVLPVYLILSTLLVFFIKERKAQ